MAETETTETLEAAAKTRIRRPSKRKANEELMKRFFEALARHDLDGMTDCWSDEVVEDIVALRVLRGKEELRASFRELFTAVPDVEITVSRMVTDQRHAVVEWRMTGTFTGGQFQGIEPTGRHIELRGLDLFVIEDDAIVTNTVYYDGMAFAREVGMLPPQDSGAERAMKSAFNAVTKVRRAVTERKGS
jgi:steroid delta-isomerase-like uncharacterized protein